MGINGAILWNQMDDCMSELRHWAFVGDRILFRKNLKILDEAIQANRETVQFTADENTRWKQLVEDGMNEKRHFHLQDRLGEIIAFWTQYFRSCLPVGTVLIG
jgi:hypothetical protein